VKLSNSQDHSGLIATIPPLWRRKMARRLAGWDRERATEAERALAAAAERAVAAPARA